MARRNAVMGLLVLRRMGILPAPIYYILMLLSSLMRLVR